MNLSNIESKFIIIPIILGNNGDTLFGSENDVLIIYNLFYKFHKLNNLEYKWIKPSILINKDVKIKNENDCSLKFTSSNPFRLLRTLWGERWDESNVFSYRGSARLCVP